MKVDLQFGGQGRDYRLKSAILIYQDEGNAANMASTVHAVELQGKSYRPVIMPGVPITILAIEKLMESLGRGTGAGFIHENVLSVGLDRMAWWCPAGRRRIWFNPSHSGDKKEAAAIKTLNGKFVHHPPLIFVARNGLNVFALPEDKRPKPDTRLYRAPYWNLSDGHMCNGNLKLPICSLENIAGFEAAFFNSQFTHTSAGAITHHKSGHNGLWAELAARKKRPPAAFWRRVLVRSAKTMGAVLK